MLASPVDTAAELVEVFPNGALVEEKFDGIRAQVHKRGDTIEMYSRTLDRITEFPELAGTLREVPGDFVLDGERICWRRKRSPSCSSRAPSFARPSKKSMLRLIRRWQKGTKDSSRKDRNRRT